jgi:formylglycine-generating enzyme required for sulfatase activity
MVIGVSLFGGQTILKDWYIGREGAVNDWIGSYEKAVADPSLYQKEDKWQFNRSKTFYNTKGDLYVITEIISDKDYLQGLSLTGSVKAITLNGKEVNRYRKNVKIYGLNLKKGKNILELHLPKLIKKPDARRNPRNNILITKVELDYLYPSVAKKIENARLAIEYLGKKYKKSYNATEYLKELDELAASNPDDKKIEDFRYKTLVLNNPELKFDKLFFRATWSTQFPPNWQGNSAYLRSGGHTRKPKINDQLMEFDLKTRKSKVVYKPADPRQSVMDICLHYSGKKFLYSGIDLDSNTFQVYEMNIDGTGKRRITPLLPEVDNYNGIYLPSGKILFCSGASLNAVPCVGGNDYVGSLYSINPDGTGMRQVAFDQENDWYPYVKDNGRVMYHRWEYTDNSHYFTRILLEMNPDGTTNRSIYASNSYWPNTLFYAKQVPGHTSLFSAVVSGHHGVSRAGELVLFDQSKGDFQNEGVIQRIPGRGKKVEAPIIDKYMAGKWPRFLHPQPLSDKFFLVSCQRTPRDKWSLYLVDVFDNMIKLNTENPENRHMFEPVPLMARKVPPVIPPRHNPKAKDATLYIQDIYEGPGLKGVRRGAVAGIRIFTYGYAYRLNGSHDALAIEGPWDTKRVLGTVPVEKDGSVMVKIPHSMPISIQPIDKDGNAMQIMRSWTAAQPGEFISCIGCHEPTRMAPLAKAAIASRKAPQKLTPYSKCGRIYGFGFQREVQPVLDKYCVGCHDGTAKNRPNFKDCSEIKFNAKAHFSKSYLALHPYVRRPGPESNLHILAPLEVHTSTSELFQMLKKGHHGVKLDEDSWRKLATWADLNVPYHATWTEVSDSKQTCEFAERTKEYKKRFAGIEDDIEWMPPLKPRPSFIKPEKLPARPPAMKIAGWPLNIGIPLIEERSIDVGKHKITFVKIPAGKFVMGSVDGAEDEFPQAVVEIKKPFLMATTEVTNGLFREYDPKHNSMFYDQQWKDHIFPGYPADKPEMPAVRLSWKKAMGFTKWLSEKTGLDVTLPTEAEWEWAARAGSDKPFFFGTKGFENYANLADQSIGNLAVRGVDPQPVPPGSRSPLVDFVPRDKSFNDGILTPTGTAQYHSNPWGLYDITGNVREWTRSSYKPYPYKDDDGRNSLNPEGKKVARGGSWRDRPKVATVSYRLPYESFQRVYNVGLRPIIEFDSEKELNAAFEKMELVSKRKWEPAKYLVWLNNKSLDVDSEPTRKTGGEGLDFLMDGTNHKWFDSAARPPFNIYMSLKGKRTVPVSVYKLISANDMPERDPKEWSFYGSKDGKEWVLLDRQKKQRFKKRFQEKVYKLKKPQPFAYYRLEITKGRAPKRGYQLSDLQIGYLDY